MSEGVPPLIPICHDDYHAEHVGSIADGGQFFLTTPFVVALGANPGREFIALYLFNAQGNLLEARIDDLGSRQSLDNNQQRALLESRLRELGEFTFGDIQVVPFQVERFDTVFGLIPQAPEEEGDIWWVIVEPGNYMAFHAPWDGLYAT